MSEERPIYNDDLGAIEGREDLWRAVLMQTIAEARGRVANGGDSPANRQRIIREARDYITIPNRDFDIVCSLAGLNPEAVREGLARQLADALTLDPLTQPVPKPRRRNRQHTFNGKSLTVAEWSERTGLSRQLIHTRLASGWTIERTLTQAPKQRRQVTLADEVTA